MAGDERSAETNLGDFPAVAQKLLEEPKRFGFFQAVQILGKLYPRRPEPGLSTKYGDELVHFQTWTSLVRSPSDIRRLERVTDLFDQSEYRMEVSFMGLYGLSSPTPSYFWEYIARNPESALRDFLDIFNTRAIGLFYQAWKRHRWHLNFRGIIGDPNTRRVFSLIGLGTQCRPGNPRLADDSLSHNVPILAEHPALKVLGDRTRVLAHAGLIAQYTQPPCNLRSMLWDYFDGPDPKRQAFVDVEENVYQWAYLAPTDHTRLGGANSRIGAGCNFVAGTRVPDRMGCFRIRLGPLTFVRFTEFLPDGSAYPRLVQLAKLGSPFGTEFDVQLQLKPAEVPTWQLGGAGGGRLGWTTWAGSQERSEPGVVLLRN